MVIIVEYGRKFCDSHNNRSLKKRKIRKKKIQDVKNYFVVAIATFNIMVGHPVSFESLENVFCYSIEKKGSNAEDALVT